MGNKMQKAREAFLEMWSDVLADREGNKELLDWLEHSGFFTAPASARTYPIKQGGVTRSDPPWRYHKDTWRPDRTRVLHHLR